MRVSLVCALSCPRKLTRTLTDQVGKYKQARSMIGKRGGPGGSDRKFGKFKG